VTTSIYLVGEPGVGKTTLMAALTARFAVGSAVQLNGLLWAEPLSIQKKWVGYRFGKTRDKFSGTDALGMAACPDAVDWVRWAALPNYLFGEGARLATGKFLDLLHQKTDFTLIHLVAENAADRRKARGSNQNSGWVRGRITHAANLARNNPQWRQVTVDTTTADPAHLANHIWNRV
jgi:hypothetical protein